MDFFALLRSVLNLISIFLSNSAHGNFYEKYETRSFIVIGFVMLKFKRNMLHLFWNSLAIFSQPKAIIGTISVLCEVLHILELLYNTVTWNTASMFANAKAEKKGVTVILSF